MVLLYVVSSEIVNVVFIYLPLVAGFFDAIFFTIESHLFFKAFEFSYRQFDEFGASPKINLGLITYSLN